MIQLNNNLKVSIIVVLVLSYLIYDRKPDCMFTDTGEFKGFGLKQGETPFPFFMVISILGFTTYYTLIIREGKYV